MSNEQRANMCVAKYCAIGACVYYLRMPVTIHQPNCGIVKQLTNRWSVYAWTVTQSGLRADGRL